ncbi:exodeoxyribonuclease III [Polaromonas sp.]|uniref:exodeoxyribonuclease III n=1 Tax=Polaromonas sp. TaxID=1869339 RepID=UPI002731A70C|nr:exodeoxyribonuclease III [Polaromonas sp.]MDP2448284.1 exodeoxyribonuclease III [Polaromonas sp.]
MKIATWNVNSLAVRLPQVLDWLAANPVDALCLQELKLSDDKFPLEALAAAGYQCAVFGQKTYNGVAILSRNPARNIVKNIVGFSDEQSRVIAATLDTPQGELRLVNGYFVNGQAPGTDKFEYKMRWLDGLRTWLKAELAAHPRLVVVGDFNITMDDRDTWDAEGLRETIHHTNEEREHLKALLGLGLHDAFRLFEQPEKSYSWWDYREFAFRRNRGLRIDYILVSEMLKPAVKGCVIDKLPRKNERPSDHVPVIAEFDLLSIT